MKNIKFLGHTYYKIGFEGRPDGEFVCADVKPKFSTIWIHRQTPTEWYACIYLNNTRLQVLGKSKPKAVKNLEALFKDISEF